MRKSITLFHDQYAFYKELKSEKLLLAFIEYMFEDKEPQWLNSIEQVIWDSLLERMDNWKYKSDAWSKWWSKSHGWWRPKKQADGLQNNNDETNKKQAKNNQVEDKDKVEDKEKKKYLDFVYLSDEEYKRISNRYWERVLKEFITRLNNWIWEKPKSKDRRDRNAYYTILSWIRKDWIKESPPKPPDNETWIYDLPF